MTEERVFIFEGVAVPQGRGRATVRNRKAVTCGAAPIVGVYDPGQSRTWKSAVKKAAKAQMAERGWEPFVDTPLWCDYRFYLPKPKSKKRSDVFVAVKPDVKNLIAAVEDALEGIVFDNDSRIVRSTEEKRYCTYETPDGSFSTEPHVRLVVRTLSDQKGEDVC